MEPQYLIQNGVLSLSNPKMPPSRFRAPNAAWSVQDPEVFDGKDEGVSVMGTTIPW